MRSLIIISLFLSLCIKAHSLTTPDESERIAVFCKLWGFLKYYHPTVADGRIDWDKEFTSRIKTATSLKSKQDISNYYSEWINSLGKLKTCKKCKNEVPDSLKFNLDLTWLTDSSTFSNNLIGQLQFIRANRNYGKNHYVRQYPFVGNTRYDREKPYVDSVFPSQELRLLSLSRYWNIINYFFPYKYVIGQDWNKVLVEMIPKFADSRDTIYYHLAMIELTTKINDSHAIFFGSKYVNRYLGTKFVPFKVKIIDNKAIVTGFYNDSLCGQNDIRYGDVFLKIGGSTVEEILKEKSRFIPASNDVTRLRNSSDIIFKGLTDSVTTTFERDGIVQEKSLARYYFRDFKYKWGSDNGNDTCKIIDGNIGYINLGLLQRKQTKRYLTKVKETKAIIIDVRNYPNGTMYNIARFLNADKKPFARFTVPDISYPGVYNYTSPYFCGGKNKTPYKGKVILLFNEDSQSHAEFTLMALKTAPNVIGIGSQTAGADGNISTITFPGNYKTYISGIGVYYPDGKETQRVGIIPDIEVRPTIEGLKAKRDEVLEKAIEAANKI